MRCGTARRLLWPGIGPQPVTDAVKEAEAHLRTCAACRDFLADHTAVAEEIERLAPRPVAPAGVRERVFERLARERVHPPAGGRRVGVRAAGLALAAAVMLALSVWVMRSEPADRGWRQQVAAVAEDHVRSTHEESIASTDTAAVQQWLSGRVPFAVHIPMIPDAAFEGARLCYLDGRRGAVLRYRVDGREMSYYLMPVGPSTLPPATPERFLRGAESGYQVVAWHDAGLVHALVGNLPEARLLELARFCVERSAARSRPAEAVTSLTATLRCAW
jgi:anti-sigma factor RsiW